jgi:transcriptional regulator with AAA-type ATPase domain
MLRLAVIIEGAPTYFPVGNGRSTIGRSRENDLVIDCKGVSRRHAIVEREGDRITIIDAQSTNGLLVGGRKVSRVTLARGKEVIIGRAIVRLEDVSTGDAEMAMLLEILNSGDSGAQTDIVSAVTDAARALLRWVRIADRDDVSTYELLFEARRIVTATALVIFNESVIAEIAGPIPPQEAIRELGTGLPEHWIAIDCREGVRLAAYFADADRSGWWCDFLSFVAAKISDRPSAVVDDSPGELVFRDAVVRGSSAGIENVYAQVRLAIESDVNVLLLGESGTGKEVIAQLIHESDPTRRERFIPVNVTAIVASMPEAELFGIIARAATEVGARDGLFRAADGGTILLDEIGDMPLPLQATLLRVVDEHTVTPVGSSESVPIDVRVISATHQDLEKLIREGSFRQDLYFRLNGITITIPPLRERPEDLAELALSFANSASRRLNRSIKGITMSAMRVLGDYRWPGNVRELKHVIDRAVLSCPRHGAIDAEHILPSLQNVTSLAPAASLDSHVSSAEATAIENALRATGGNRSKAARALGVSRVTLHKKMKEYGIK